MERFHRVAQNSASGLPIANPTITVFHVGTVVAAPIFSDEGATAKANPFTGDSLGRFDFYAPDGDYDVQVAGAGVTTYVIADVTLGDPKRAQAITEAETWLLSNALYRRSGTAGHDRRDTAKPAWAIEMDADVAQDFVRVLRAAAGANPITWTELLKILSTGIEFGMAFSLTGDITPASLGASANDYNPTGLATASTIRQASSVTVNITGLAGGADGRLILLHNIGAFAITLTDEDALSLAANRFALSAPFTLEADESTLLQYDATVLRWRLASGQQRPRFEWIGNSGGLDLNTAVGTQFLAVSGSEAVGAAEADREMIVDAAREAIRFRTNLPVAPGTTATRTLTVRKNGVDTALTVTYGSAELGLKVVTATVAFAAGDRISIASVVGTAVAAASRAQWAARMRD